MPGIRARVENGRFVIDEPTDLPDGTVLELVVNDEGDDLDEAEHAAINKVIAKSLASLQAGRGRPAEAVLADLRTKR